MRWSMRAVERVAVHRQRGQQRRVTGPGRPQLARRVGGRRRLVAGLEQLERSQDALAVGRLDARPHALGQLRVQPFDRPRVGGEPRADRGVDRRSEVELGECRPQVQAGAADDDRPSALRDQRVDLGVGPFGVGAGRERLGDRHEAEQAVLEPLALRVRRGAGQDRQSVIDLQRVRRHRDRVLPPRAQALGERDRDRRLPHAGGAEHGDDEWRRRHGEPVSGPRRAAPAAARPGRRGRGARSIVSDTMGVRIGTGLSTVPDGRTAALEAASAASVELGGEPCELAIVFVSGSILSASEAGSRRCTRSSCRRA